MSSRATYGLCLVMTGLLTCVSGAGPLAPNSGGLSDNLSLWLRMPGIHYDPVAGIWTDLSDKGNDALADVANFVGPTLSSGENAIVFSHPFSTVNFDPDVADMLRSVNLNEGAGLSELTIFVVVNTNTTASNSRSCGFGAYQDGGRADHFNLAGDVSIRKDNGSIGGATASHPTNEFIIRVGRMNPGSINQWFNSDGSLALVHDVTGSSYTTGTDSFYLGDLRRNDDQSGMIEIAEVAVFNRALTDAQVEGVCEWLQANVGRVAKTGASGAVPGHEATDVSRDVTLSWNPVATAVKRDVYFGSSFEDVNTATVATAAGLDVTSFDPGRLEFETTYFWRVDEVNGTPDKTVFRGDVWSFEVEPYAIAIPGSTIAVTASSAANEFSMPEKTVDGSGLDPNTGTHAIDPETMWFTAAVDLDPWIQFEFDDVKKVDVMTVWNSNGSAESAIGWGVKDVQIQYSVDGEKWDVLGDTHQFSRAPGLPTYNEPDQISFNGVAAQYVRLNIQSNWGGVLMSYSLSEVQFSMIPVQARTPDPASGSVDILPNARLTWRAGREAVQSTVYVSTDPNEVADGAAVSATINGNSIDLTSLDLQMGQAYYWRVDEINEAEAMSVWAGPVWSLSTVASLVVDDFQPYGNISPNRPFQTWLDGFGYSADEFFPAGYGGNGTGAGIGHDIWSLSSPHYDGDIMEGTITKSGRSMPLYFNNTNGLSLSETQRTFEQAQDWTVNGIQSLSLNIYGDPNNSGQLYLKINDTRINYVGLSDALQRQQWIPWNIDLSDVPSLQNVARLAIGIEGAGATGLIYLDDIRLYPLTPETIDPVVPDDSDPNLVTFYEFEGNANDSAGDKHAAVAGAPLYIQGKIGQAISLDGFVDHVVHTLGTEEIWSATSVSLWARTDMLTQAVNSGLFNNNSADNDFQIDMDGSDPGAYRYSGTGGSGLFGPVMSEWVHLAMSCDGTATNIYYNGLFVRSIDVANTQFGQIAVGINRGMVVMFAGQIDDVRVYNRALSHAEIAGLTGLTEPVPAPF